MQLGLGGPVIPQEGGLLPYAAGQGHHVAGAVVDHHNGGLELLLAVGSGHVAQLLVDLIHLLLNLHVQRHIDVIAALLNPFQIQIPVRLGQIIPVFPVLLREIGSKVQNHSVHIPAVDVLGGVGRDRGQVAADRAVVIPVLSNGKIAPGAGVAAGQVFADGPPVFIGNAFLEDQLLVHGVLVFLLGQIALLIHLFQHIELPDTVPPRAVPLFPSEHIDVIGMGIVEGGVVGNADQACALGHGQVLQLLAEILRGGALHAVAAPSQVDTVQVLLHNHVFIIVPFADLGTENLHDLPLNGDALVAGGVFHQLLGDGGAAELVAAAEEHVEAGLHRGDPVHALMLVEPLILNGHHSVDHGLGDFLQIGPLTVGGGIDLLQLLDVSRGVHIINKGSFLQNIIVQGPVRGL